MHSAAQIFWNICSLLILTACVFSACFPSLCDQFSVCTCMSFDIPEKMCVFVYMLACVFVTDSSVLVELPPLLRGSRLTKAGNSMKATNYTNKYLNCSIQSFLMHPLKGKVQAYRFPPVWKFVLNIKYIHTVIMAQTAYMSSKTFPMKSNKCVFSVVKVLKTIWYVWKKKTGVRCHSVTNHF